MNETSREKRKTIPVAYDENLPELKSQFLL